jgi:hypothetical protein
MRTILGGVLGKVPRPTPALAVALLALLIACSGAAVAAIPSADGAISACYDGKSGLLRVIDTERGQTCTSKEIGPLAFATKGAVDDVAVARQAADGEIGRNIFLFKQENVHDHEVLTNGIADEAEARQAADTQLQEQIDALKQP